MPLDDQLGSGQRQDALKPLGFLTVGQYRVEAYLQERKASCTRRRVFPGFKEVGLSFDGVPIPAWGLARDLGAQGFTESSQIYNIILIYKVSGKIAYGYDRHGNRPVTLKLDARPKGELVFWVDERLGRNDFPWIFTDEMIDMILEGLEFDFKMALVNSVEYWGVDGLFDEKYQVAKRSSKQLDICLRTNEYGRDEWLHRVAFVGVMDKTVQWAQEVQQAQQDPAGKKQYTPKKKASTDGGYLIGDRLVKAMELLNKTEDDLVDESTSNNTRRWFKDTLTAKRKHQANPAAAAAAAQAGPAPRASMAGALLRSPKPEPSRPAQRSPGQQLLPSHPGTQLAPYASPNKRKAEAAGPAHKKSVQGQVQDSVSVPLSPQHGSSAKQRALFAQVPSPQRPPAGAIISSSISSPGAISSSSGIDPGTNLSSSISNPGATISSSISNPGAINSSSGVDPGAINSSTISNPGTLMPGGAVPQATGTSFLASAAMPAPASVSLPPPVPNLSPVQVRPLNLGAALLQSPALVNLGQGLVPVLSPLMGPVMSPIPLPQMIPVPVPVMPPVNIYNINGVFFYQGPNGLLVQLPPLPPVLGPLQ